MVDLSENEVKDVPQIDKLMNYGNSNRQVGATKMNAQSSRSHSIFTIELCVVEVDGTSTKGAATDVGDLATAQAV